jgi:hypothetical protein
VSKVTTMTHSLMRMAFVTASLTLAISPCEQGLVGGTLITRSFVLPHVESFLAEQPSMGQRLLMV